MNAKTRAYLNAIVQSYLDDPRVTSTLAQITSDPHWAMAIRRYAQKVPNRNWSRFNAQWAWTAAEEDTFRHSPTYQNLQNLVQQVKTSFAAQSAMSGYSLSTNLKARNLGTQIGYWNGNDTVAALGNVLIDKLQREFDVHTYPDDPAEGDALQRFHDFLVSVSLSAHVVRNGHTLTVTTPTHAVPGLSDHGRLSAVDFVVKQGTTTIAGTDSGQRSIWMGQTSPNKDFKAALSAAVQTANTNSASNGRFEGPLTAPDEPWHYTFIAPGPAQP